MSTEVSTQVNNNAQQQPHEERSHRATPAVDILEYDDRLELLFDLPGATREQLDINIEGDLLSVSTSGATRERDMHLRAREFSQVDYFRQFQINRKYDLNRVEANFEQGELRLQIPKSEDERPRKILIS